MPLTTSISLFVAGIGLYVAALSWRLSRAPGWSEQVWFACLAVSASFYSVASVALSLGLPTRLAPFIAPLQVLLFVLHIGAWIRYSVAFAGPRLSRIEWICLFVLPVAGLLAFFPGLLFAPQLVSHSFTPLGIDHQYAEHTTYGGLVVVLAISIMLLPIRRFHAAWRAGVRGAFAHLVTVWVLLVMALNDTLINSGSYQGLHLLDFTIVVPVIVVAYSLTGRFIENGKMLQDLRSRLESLVSERTRQLGESHDALLRAEKLVALGQFSAGVAHGINNPAAVVTANLRYLIESLQASGRLPEDGFECLMDSSQSMDRIAGIVRHLLDASRIAAAGKAPDQPVRIVDAVVQAVEESRKGSPQHRIEVEVPDDLYALAEEQMLVKVLVNLLNNACQAVPLSQGNGQIRVTGTRDGERIRIEVADNGCGMTKELLRRLFEPFFSTRPVGAGLGLGLAVARGLLASLQGDLHLESRPGVGTRAIVELPAVMNSGLPPDRGPA